MYFRCPKCGNTENCISIDTEYGRDIVHGVFSCENCGAEFIAVYEISCIEQFDEDGNIIQIIHQ